MIVPQFWAEGRVQHRQKERQIIARRFGWSDTSPVEAQAIADARANDALKRLLSGEKLARRELKVPYNGAHGVPIREEILERFGSAIITRNVYGARCLNTPNVLFADVDFDKESGGQFVLVALVIPLIIGISTSWLAHSKGLGLALGTLALLITSAIVITLNRRRMESPDRYELESLARIDHFLSTHPEWSLRRYRTPAGMRLLATHRTFDPNEPIVTEFFRAIKADPLYVTMCRNQQCFRARLTAKPWRIGISEHMRPRPGVWPVHPDRLAMRDAWVQRYEAAAQNFAACSFLDTIGTGIIHPEIAPVQELHDLRSKVMSGQPIA